MPNDIVYDPEFVEIDGSFAIGQSVWARGYDAWILSKIQLIRKDNNFNRYFVSTPIRSFWTSTVENLCQNK